MTISPHQAADALKEIASAAVRSRELEGYATAAPILIMWGIICTAGYGAVALSPDYSFVWLPLVVVGMVGTIILSRRAKGRSPALKRAGGRIAATWLALLVFYIAASAVLQPSGGPEAAAFPALLVGLSYALMGIWTWPRYTVLGAAVGTLTLLGYFFAAPYYSAWMAAVMGGGLVLGGLWLRKA